MNLLLTILVIIILVALAVWAVRLASGRRG